ncbi:hypothetical protein PRIPAC_91212 [Pristionchus pacificus]|uniref:Uncharacterized protein n=1 Tax=Pristionchus pacificus TaxID=54126 RepID=A0A2A6B7A8_PRIPA|nr:hypothetical protein PRIPAC_91212 [Pristionchus pacificus]|eukprot:PDM61756.1 hypothetical protein PRIPAC_51198 [Pristionchus pacificus]
MNLKLQSNEEKYKLSFRLKNEDIIQWKIFFYNTLTILGVNPADSTDCYARNIDVHLIPEEMAVLLDSLKPFMDQNTIKLLTMGENICIFLIRAFSVFLENAFVKEAFIGYNSSEEENREVLDMALKFQFADIILYLTILSKDSLQFAFQLADMAKKITLWICNHVDKKVIVRAVVENKEIGIGSQLGLFHVSVGVTSMSDLTINHLELDKEY